MKAKTEEEKTNNWDFGLGKYALTGYKKRETQKKS